MMVLAANAPDADAFVWFTGTMRYIEYHRTYTHTLTFLPVVALLPMLLARAKFSWRSYLAAFIGVLSHLLLDWTNAYGIPLTLPFSLHHFRLDINNILDVWILAILLYSRSSNRTLPPGQQRDRRAQKRRAPSRLGLGSASRPPDF